MRKATFFASVEVDLLAIFTYIAEASDSIAVAESFVRKLRDQCHRLAGLPGMLGRTRPELLPGIRTIAYKGYVIFFRYVEDRFEVVNILEGHRDIVAFFEEEADS